MVTVASNEPSRTVIQAQLGMALASLRPPRPNPAPGAGAVSGVRLSAAPAQPATAVKSPPVGEGLQVVLPNGRSGAHSLRVEKNLLADENLAHGLGLVLDFTWSPPSMRTAGAPKLGGIGSAGGEPSASLRPPRPNPAPGAGAVSGVRLSAASAQPAAAVESPPVGEGRQVVPGSILGLSSESPRASMSDNWH